METTQLVIISSSTRSKSWSSPRSTHLMELSQYNKPQAFRLFNQVKYNFLNPSHSPKYSKLRPSPSCLLPENATPSRPQPMINHLLLFCPKSLWFLKNQLPQKHPQCNPTTPNTAKTLKYQNCHLYFNSSCLEKSRRHLDSVHHRGIHSIRLRSLLMIFIKRK